MAFEPGNAPHFFKIIQPQIVENGRLRIPKKFVAKYAKDLSDHVYLKVPNDELWMVNLSISNGEIWLQEGWKEFAEHYSIGLWHFLVFRYEGNSNFHVLIFDTSASEIEYPSPKTIHEERTNLDGESQLKRKGIIDEDIVEGRKGMASDSENERALQSAKAFTSRNPFFMVTIRPSYVTAKSGLNIPQVFAKKYFSKEESANVTLQVADGMKVWSVKCLLLKNCARLTNGWIGFVQDNHVQVGDVCILELINSVENLFNVVIFRASETADAPCFFKIIQPQIVQDGRLRIPKKFVAKYAKDLSNRVYLKVPNGEMWMVKMTISNGEVWLQDSWKEFTDHYSIGLWHFLVFKYEGNSHFHVLIFDMSASEIEYPSPKNIHEERANLDGKSKMKRKGVMDEDNIKSKKTRSNSEYKEMKHVKTEEDPHPFDFVKEIGDGASRPMPNTHEVLHQVEKRRIATE